MIVSEKEFKEEIDKLLLDYGLKIDMQEQEVKLKLRIVKEYNKIKEIVILNVE
ncbi:hypothetical protein IU839_001268 [Campylobacter coli]|nr:hypothetical protein [Campylobacter coli]